MFDFKQLDFSNAKILIIGDVMLDRYWHGVTSRISPEAPVPVVHVTKTEERPGGAANVALNTASLGANTTILGLVGNDSEATFIQEKLEKNGIICKLHRIPNKATTTKLRILSKHQQLIRLDFENYYNKEEADILVFDFISDTENYDAIIISDYGKGSLHCCLKIIETAKKRGIPIFVDPKKNDFGFYKGSTCIKPNLKEFEAIVGPCKDKDDIVKRGMELIKKYSIEHLLITKGDQGMILISSDGDTLYLPARGQEVYDVTGAGDTAVASLAVAVASGFDFARAVHLANLAAGISVSKLGASAVGLSELRRAIHSNIQKTCWHEDELIYLIEDARVHNEKVVMTNGCFDIIHAGHIRYLEQAKALGDRLIIAVNDDDSVRRLKGSDRPINTIDKRMSVLGALSAVDWVVPFSENTPERIIKKFRPDILVKGGDYKVDEIVGSAFVIESGGEVKVLEFVDECSTTSTINKIKKLSEDVND